MADIDELLSQLAIKPNNHQLFIQALTHRSYLNENEQAKISNERLEFLGDSVLSILTSTELYQRFPQAPEGDLTNMRSSLVRTETLAILSKKLHFGDYLLLSRGEEKSGGRENVSLLADTFEAMVGAIYLDQGLEAVKELLANHLFPLIKDVATEKTFFDYKSKLQEVTQRTAKASPVYKVVSETGPDHDKTFTVSVFLQSKQLSFGTGKSKQDAEQDAARIALDKLNR